MSDLCPACRKKRRRAKNRTDVRRSRRPLMPPGTVLLKPADTEKAAALIAAIGAARTADEAAALAVRLVRLLRAPVVMAVEELVESRRPKERRGHTSHATDPFNPAKRRRRRRRAGPEPTDMFADIRRIPTPPRRG